MGDDLTALVPARNTSSEPGEPQTQILEVQADLQGSGGHQVSHLADRRRRAGEYRIFQTIRRMIKQGNGSNTMSLVDLYSTTYLKIHSHYLFFYQSFVTNV